MHFYDNVFTLISNVWRTFFGWGNVLCVLNNDLMEDIMGSDNIIWLIERIFVGSMSEANSLATTHFFGWKLNDNDKGKIYIDFFKNSMRKS